MAWRRRAHASHWGFCIEILWQRKMTRTRIRGRSRLEVQKDGRPPYKFFGGKGQPIQSTGPAAGAELGASEAGKHHGRVRRAIGRVTIKPAQRVPRPSGLKV